MPSSLSINRLINVTVNLSPQAAQMQNLSTLLLLGTSDVIDVNQRIRSYGSLDAVIADFGSSAPEALAATLYYEQSPQPTTLMIGRWARTATAARLTGAVLSTAQQALTNFTAITSGSFELLMNGVPVSITGLNFSSATNLNGVASIMQTALAAASAGTTMVWNATSQQFQVESGSNGVTSTLGFFNAPTATGSAAFSGQPTAADTITIDGTTVTFVSALTTGNQILIGGTLAATLQNALTFLSGSTDVNLSKILYYVANNTLYFASAVTGATGNTYTLAKSSTAITLSGATLTGGSGTDVSALFGTNAAASGSYIAQGIAAESAVNCVAALDNQFGQSWYGLQMVAGADADRIAVAGLVEGLSNKHYFGITSQEAAMLVATDTTNIAYQLKQLGYARTCVQYSSTNPHAVASYLARILTTNYNGNNTVITMMYKQEPGIVPEQLSLTQVQALEGFNANVFLEYNNNTAIIENGVSCNGTFTDIVLGTDWLALDIQNTLYNILYLSPTKIPQTDAGNHILVTGIESVCSQGVANGLGAPGVWESQGFGSLNDGDFLDKGFYVYAPPIATQSVADRSARKSVPFQVAFKLAGAIHTVDVLINVNR